MIMFNSENMDELVKALFADDDFKDKLIEMINEAISDQIGDHISNYLSEIEVDADRVTGLSDKVESIINGGTTEISFSA